MKDGRYALTTVRCPFYKYQEGRRICCEGPLAHMSVFLGFRSLDDRDRWLVRFCKRDHEGCFLSRALSSLYR